jgi:hypothetical protein
LSYASKEEWWKMETVIATVVGDFLFASIFVLVAIVGHVLIRPARRVERRRTSAAARRT